ncbi:MAG: glycosyltransferase [Acetatifactor sp.]|nr:glycosyltransferase [Acetatifactor sp.]
MKKCAFVIPIFIKTECPERLTFFKQTIDSIYGQTCDDWLMILVDDNSQNSELDAYVDSIIRENGEKVIYKKNPRNYGAGESRNIGIALADEAGVDVVMFLDSDDVAHPRRVELTKDSFENKDIDVLYSYFIPIDECTKELPAEKFPHNIQFILENDKHALVGDDIWKKLISEKVYVNLTSSTSVRTDLAKTVPFPSIRSSEDLYVWMMYSAVGGKYDYTDEIPSKYRMPQKMPGRSLSTCYGEVNMNRDFADAYVSAIGDCINAALSRGAIQEDEVQPLMVKAYHNVLNELEIAGMDELLVEYSDKLLQ